MQLHTHVCLHECARTDKGVSVVDSSTPANRQRHAKEMKQRKKVTLHKQTNKTQPVISGVIVVLLLKSWMPTLLAR